MTTEVLLELSEPGADAQRLDELASGLRRELLELDVDDVSPASSGEAPEGTRGLELAAVGALVLVLKDSASLVEQVVTTVRSWLRRAPEPESARALKLTLNGHTLELTAATADQQQQLVGEFVRAAMAGPSAGSG